MSDARTIEPGSCKKDRERDLLARKSFADQRIATLLNRLQEISIQTLGTLDLKPASGVVCVLHDLAQQFYERHRANQALRNL